MNLLLIVAGGLSALAALLHLGCIYFGAPWYRFFGAGERMAALASQGSRWPTLITLGIASMLGIWSLYAFSAAGVIGRLPLLRTCLILIGCIYLIRGMGGFYFVTRPMGRSRGFWIWSSGICLTLGLCHLLGLKQQWALLS
ncbi:hypothetical protein LZP73_09610 [Shewanella sp. AS16]|uniref:hypothetical protein n=1 Tax=Shewanella sp. AS16 TaxID=2907625 RepID=UPI001F3ECAB6|nr:hypothetical protein [Shewanella sp. AS16]MCE9686467.1 hypothetical protein [Shewanella sp. AS16]